MKVDYKDNSEQVLSAIEKAIKNGLEAIGLTAEGHAKKITPVDTGRLRNSMAHAVDDDAAHIGTNTSCAIFVETGARGRSGVHMLQRAASEHADEYKRLMEDSMKNA